MEPKTDPGGLLGADYEIANGRYRFKKVYGGANWWPELRAPLAAPGVDVKAGEYLLAVRGMDLKPPTEVYSLFENTADKSIEITVGPNPDGKGSRTVTVEPLATLDEERACATSTGSRATAGRCRRRPAAGWPTSICPTPVIGGSLAPHNRLQQTTVRLSDGTAEGRSAITPQPFRCVCEPEREPVFTGTHCHGTPGAECFPVGIWNVDAADRRAAPERAIFECLHDHAHLADLPLIVEGIQAGLPGSGANLATADQSSHRYSATVRWDGVAVPTWSLSGNTGIVDLTVPAPFRCAGGRAWRSRSRPPRIDSRARSMPVTPSTTRCSGGLRRSTSARSAVAISHARSSSPS